MCRSEDRKFQRGCFPSQSGNRRKRELPGFEHRYKNEGKEKAYFDYTIKATDFNVKRAYNEIKLFKEIVTAAENAEGIISLDYAIKGVLNNQMEPVMASL